MFKNNVVNLLIIITLLIQRVVYANDIDEQLQNIPKKDQQILEEFFSNMISFEYFGFVLFGEKPIAAAGFDTVFTPEEALTESAIKQYHIHAGWQTWEKYAKLFPSKNFVLRLSKSSKEPSFNWIALINKETTLKCIKNNLSVFRSVLGNSAEPESILEALITKKDIFDDVLNKHDGLLGLLFGYGKNNSMQFHKEHKIVKNNIPFKNKILSRTKKLGAFHKQSRNLFVVDLPRFAADLEDLESKNLYQSYEKTRYDLTKIYQNKEFLKTTLEILTSI